MKRILSTALLGTSLLASASAFAGEGYLVANATLRAGPDVSYPSVVRLRAGTPVGIEGCVDGYSWCDVTTGEDRGWVSANYLQEEYQGRRVLVPEYGVQIGIPVVSFVFGNYWDSYYRGRPWYSSREHWSHVHPRYYSSASYGHSGGSYGHSGGSYGQSGGSYGHSGSAYSGTHNSTTYSGTHRVESQVSQPAYSGQHRSGTVTSTTQPSYQASHTRATYQTAPSHNVTQHNATSRSEVTAESRAQQSHVNRAPASERNMNPPRSASGEQHSAAGQARATEVHDRNLARAQQKTTVEHQPQAQKAHKDAKSDNDHGGGGGKDKNHD